MIYCFADNCFIDDDSFYVLSNFKSILLRTSGQVSWNISNISNPRNYNTTLMSVEPDIINILVLSLISNEI